jgi:hypothetical protein
MLIHACVHRQLHVAAPYFVEDRTYFGGDRLIWLRDIFLLANSLSDREWNEFAALAEEKGVSEVCRESVALAYDRHGTAPTRQFAAAPVADKRTRASSYLKGSQSKRALMDLRSVAGLRGKLVYFAVRALPSTAMIRAKYPRMRHLPVSFLYARRFVELLLPRPGRGRG